MVESSELRGLARTQGGSFESIRMRGAIGARLFDDGPVTHLGRYEVRELLGRGGMGSVYAAWDPDLQRRVAIKRLLGPASEASRMRLVREASALAALSHPNVVTVYEVGRERGELFVVMELVEGESLSTWIARREHFDRARFVEALGLLLQAGRGLVAAHDAGILHRDVKPGNVLLGHDRGYGSDTGELRARMADFGLARTLDLPDDDALDIDATGDTTQDCVGTPAYMPPEQLDGGVADAKSDQFAFCVMAYETIYGVAPFAGSTIVERRLAIDRGARRPPKRRGVPRSLFAVLARGLAPAPAERHRDLHKLLAALEGFTRRRSQVVLGVAALAVLGAAAAAGGERAPAPAPDPCAQLRPLTTWWSGEPRSAVGDAIADAGLEPRSAELIDDAMAVHAARFDDAWARACDADTAAERDERIACLVEHRDAVAIVADALAHDRGTLREQGVAGVLALADPGECNDAASKRHEQVHDALQRELVAVLARASAEAGAGRSAAALALAVGVHARALAAGRASLDAEARLRIARLMLALARRSQARQWAEAAFDIATTAGDDERAARAAFVLLGASGGVGEDEAAHVRRLAETALARVPDDRHLRVDYLTELGLFLRDRGDADALRQLELALELGDAEGRDDPLWRISIMNEIAQDLTLRHRDVEARAYAEQIAAFADAELGAEHPIALRMRASLAEIIDISDPPRAEALYRELLESVPRALGAQHSAYGTLLGRVAVHRMRAGNLEEGLALTRRSMAIFAANEGQQLQLAASHYQLAYAYLQRNDLDDAEREFKSAYELAEEDPRGRDILSPAIGLANIASRRGDYDRAIALMQRVLAVSDHGEADGRVVQVLSQLATAQLDSGRFEDARATLARAVPMAAVTFGSPSHRLAELMQLQGDLYQHDGDLDAALATYVDAERMMVMVDPPRWRVVGYARLRMAELSWAIGDEVTARAMANAAGEAYAQDPHASASQQLVREWLAAHPARARTRRGLQRSARSGALTPSP